MFSFGKLIKKVRKRGGFTQNQLAELVGCSQNHIAQIETHRSHSSVEMLEKILNAIHIHHDLFLKEAEEMFADPEKNRMYSEIFNKLVSLSTEDLHYISSSISLFTDHGLKHSKSQK